MAVLTARANVYGGTAAKLAEAANAAAKAFAGKDGQVVEVDVAEATLTGDLGARDCWAAVATITVDTDSSVQYTR